MNHSTGTLWLTKAQAAKQCNVSVRTLERYIHDGTLPAYLLAGRGTVRLKADDVDALFALVQPATRTEVAA